MEPFAAAAFRIGLLALYFIGVKSAGARSLRTRQSPSRKTISITQGKPFAAAQRSRTSGPSAAVSNAAGVMQKTRFPLDPAAGFAHALDHGDASQSWPIMALPRSGDIVGHGGSPRLDAAAIAIGHLMQAD